MARVGAPARQFCHASIEEGMNHGKHEIHERHEMTMAGNSLDHEGTRMGTKRRREYLTTKSTKSTKETRRWGYLWNKTHDSRSLCPWRLHYGVIGSWIFACIIYH